MKIKSLEEIYLYSLPIKVSATSVQWSLSYCSGVNKIKLAWKTYFVCWKSFYAEHLGKECRMRCTVKTTYFAQSVSVFMTLMSNLFFVHAGGWDHWLLPGVCTEGWGAQDHACPETDQSWSANQVQGEPAQTVASSTFTSLCSHNQDVTLLLWLFAGFCRHWWLQRPRGSGCEMLQRGGHSHPWSHHSGQAVHRPRQERLLG